MLRALSAEIINKIRKYTKYKNGLQNKNKQENFGHARLKTDVRTLRRTRQHLTLNIGKYKVSRTLQNVRASTGRVIYPEITYFSIPSVWLTIKASNYSIKYLSNPYP